MPDELTALSNNLRKLYTSAGEEWSGRAVMRAGRVARSEWYLRDSPDPSAGPRAVLRQNYSVFVDRSLSANPNDPLQWLHVYARTRDGGTVTGWVRSDGLLLDPPEPTARVEVVSPGDNLLGLAARNYKPASGFTWGQDARFYVYALAYVNRGGGALIFPRGWTAADFKATGRWKEIGVRAGQPLWLPRRDHLDHLKGTFVSSGSLSYEAWQRLKSAAAAVWDEVVGSVAFAAGLIHGALQSLYDLFAGAIQLLVTAWKVVKSLFTGQLLEDAKKLWDAISKIDWGGLVSGLVKEFLAGWTNPDPWTRGYFRGRVCGYVIAEILMLVFSFGVVSGLKWAGKAGKFAVVALRLAENPVVRNVAGKVGKAAEVVDAATKGKLIQEVTEALVKLQRVTRTVAGKAKDQVFTVVEELLADGSKRTVSIEGKIRNISGRKSHSGYDRASVDHHGHLIADSFGGPGSKTSGNIVGMHGYQNHSGEYRDLERRIAERLGDGDGHMKVTVIHESPTDWRPYSFEVEVTFANGSPPIKQTIYNFAPYLKP